MEINEYDFIKEIRDGTLDVMTWLANQDEDTIRGRVYGRVPEDLDISVGSYEYDAIEPTNTEFAIAYFMLRNIILLAFPQCSYGEWLTLSAASHGVDRKQATYASGTVLIHGNDGLTIPAGTKFTNTIPLGSSIPIKSYTSLYDATIVDSEAEIAVIADEIGNDGNAFAGEINLNISDIVGITSIYNEKAFTNGMAEESDGALLKRLLERVRNPPSSGNKEDYKRWAKEISGVENADVISLWNGPGTVKVIISGKLGDPIPELLSIVKEYLDPVDHEGEGEGRAPVGAVVTVVTVAIAWIKITIYQLEVKEGYSVSTVKDDILLAIKQYMSTIPPGGMVRVKEIEAVISNTKGVLDFRKALVNDSTSNLSILREEKPSVSEVVYENI